MAKLKPRPEGVTQREDGLWVDETGEPVHWNVAANAARWKYRDDNPGASHYEITEAGKRAWVKQRHGLDSEYAELMRAKARHWNSSNSERRTELRRRHAKRRRSTPLGRTLHLARERQRQLARALGSPAPKAGRCGYERNFGCDRKTLEAWLQAGLPEGMILAAATEAGLHLDHVRPLSSFDLTNKDQWRLAFNYRNLRLIPAADNLAKSDRYTADDEAVWAKRMLAAGWNGDLFLRHANAHRRRFEQLIQRGTPAKLPVST